MGNNHFYLRFIKVTTAACSSLSVGANNGQVAARRGVFNDDGITNNFFNGGIDAIFVALLFHA